MKSSLSSTTADSSTKDLGTWDLAWGQSRRTESGVQEVEPEQSAEYTEETSDNTHTDTLSPLFPHVTERDTEVLGGRPSFKA